MYLRSKFLPRYFSFQLRGSETQPQLTTLTSPELIDHYGYSLEEHVVRTRDGYYLGVQRIPSGRRAAAAAPAPKAEAAAAPKAESPPFPTARPRDGRSAASAGSDSEGAAARWGPEGSGRRPPVLLVHGLMMSSEAWLMRGERSLPFMLADAGYDVWLGNVRGNKYSLKHATRSPKEDSFWNFSMDELAREDVPAMLEHICTVTGHERVHYIGFSNGTASMFAALTVPALQARVASFVALAPAVALKGISSSAANALIESGLDFVYLVFGTREMLPVTNFYMRVRRARVSQGERSRIGSCCLFFVPQVCSTPLLVRILDFCLFYLFAWTTGAMDQADKRVLYYHFYSYTSVKSVVHWFQIIRARRFQMYNDERGSHSTPVRPFL